MSWRCRRPRPLQWLMASPRRPGSLVAAYRANTPLIVTAGQQTREMSLCDPYLNNPDATLMPQPWVKWAYEPARAEDVPAAFMRAYAVAMQPPTWIRSDASALKQPASSASFFWSLTPGFTQLPCGFARLQYSKWPISSEKATL